MKQGRYSREEVWGMDPIEAYKSLCEGKVGRFPHGYWSLPGWEVRVKAIVKYLIEDQLALTDDEIKTCWGANFLRKHRLIGLLNITFKNHPFLLIDFVYPNRFKMWEFNKVGTGYWTKETGVECLKWIIEEELGLTHDELKKCWTLKFIKEHGMYRVIQQVFKCDLYAAIDAIYPNTFKRWELPVVAHGFWNEETGKEAIKWLLEEKLKLTDEEIKEQWSHQFISKHGLAGMVYQVFENNLYNAIHKTYPGRFKAWEFRSVSKDFWNQDTRSAAIKWLLEEKLQLSDVEIKDQWSYALLHQHGMAGVVMSAKGQSLYDVFNHVYPNRFEPWEFRNVPRRYWTQQTAIKAMRWLVEEKLKLTPEEANQGNISSLMKAYRLGGAMTIFPTPKDLLVATYPQLQKTTDV